MNITTIDKIKDYPFLDSNLGLEQRVQDLVSRLTINKFAVIGPLAKYCTRNGIVACILTL